MWCLVTSLSNSRLVCFVAPSLEKFRKPGYVCGKGGGAEIKKIVLCSDSPVVLVWVVFSRAMKDEFKFKSCRCLLSITEVQLTSLSSWYAQSSGLTGVLARGTHDLRVLQAWQAHAYKSVCGELLLQPASTLGLT